MEETIVGNVMITSDQGDRTSRKMDILLSICKVKGTSKRDNKAQFHQAKGNGRCYNCGKPGHVSKYCRRGRNRDEDQNQQSGRVFALDARDVMGSDPLTKGKRML